MRSSDFIIFLVLIGGCAYYSKTDVTIIAQKAVYPLGISGIHIENGLINIHREMNALGINYAEEQ